MLLLVIAPELERAGDLGKARRAFEIGEALINHGAILEDLSRRWSRHEATLRPHDALTVRAAIDEGAQTFDMLWGAETHKRLWASDTKTLRRFDLFPADLGGRICRHAVQARRHLAPLARRVLTFGESRAV